MKSIQECVKASVKPIVRLELKPEPVRWGRYLGVPLLATVVVGVSLLVADPFGCEKRVATAKASVETLQKTHDDAKKELAKSESSFSTNAIPASVLLDKSTKITASGVALNVARISLEDEQESRRNLYYSLLTTVLLGVQGILMAWGNMKFWESFPGGRIRQTNKQGAGLS